MSKPANKCIFCGESKMSKEHIYAEWMSPYLQKRQINYEARTTTIRRDGNLTSKKLIAGDPHSGKTRVVCKRCNNDWMSRLQSETKPILIPLMLGKRSVLSQNDQRKLAAWITMFTMVSEFKKSNVQKAAIPFSERFSFYKHPKAHENWKIWIANYERETWGELIVRTTFPVSDNGLTPELGGDGMPIPNTQATTFVVGRLYVHVYSSQLQKLVNDQRLKAAGFVRLWPLAGRVIKWPPEVTIYDAEAEAVAFTAIRAIARKTGG